MLRAHDYQAPYNMAPGTTEPYRGTDHTVATMIRLAKGYVDPRDMVRDALVGERSIPVRRHTEQIIHNLRPKDYASEIIAICRWWGNAGRYTRDPLHVEMLRSPDRLIADANAGRLACDCIPEGTLLLRDDYQLVPIEAVEAGDRIWGDERWSEVQAVWSKGDLAVDAVELNTGTTMHLTADHKVYVVMPGGGIERLRVADLEPGMVLLSPGRIPFGRDDSGDPDEMLLQGLYLSDGWKDKHDIRIAGKDGHPKEAQKREVERVANRLGYGTSWNERYITVSGRGIVSRFAEMGAYAPEKRALTLDLGEAQATALLRGIMADSGANTGATSRTFSTTSPMLAIQTRLLHKMFGIRMSMRRVDDHGGLGTNPIYRLGQRLHSRWHPVKVKRIEREVAVRPCFDITTDDHKVYLPAHDVTVSNCDEFALAIATCCLTIGARAQFVTVGFTPRLPGQPKIHTHVFARAQDPRTKVWWVLDPVAGRRVKQMLSRVKQYTVFEVD